jgi:Tol biopolymer transport system component
MRNPRTNAGPRSLLLAVAIALLAADGPRTHGAGQEPERFGEGVVSTPDYDFFTTFTPDQKTLYFCKATPTFSHFTIVSSERKGEGWSEPRVVSFSGRYSDADPRLSADGRTMFFVSDRPDSGSQPRADLDIWKVERRGEGWGEPSHLGRAVNSASNEYSPSVLADGSLIFGALRPGGKRYDLWISKPVAGIYGEPVNLGDSINTAAGEIDPYVTPDGRTIVFGSAGRPDGLGDIDLYVSFRKADGWTAARHLGGGVNSSATDFSPTISPDGRWLYFTSTRGDFDAAPAKPLDYPELVHKLRSRGNGLGDVYRVPVEVLGAP